MWGTLANSAKRILAPNLFEEVSTLQRILAAFRVLTMASASAFRSSLSGMTRTCSGDNQVGKSPAKCSIRIPTKRSIEPNGAR